MFSKVMSKEVMKAIEFYVGIDLHYEKIFHRHFSNCNSSPDSGMHMEILWERDDPNGYYTYCISATSWKSYNSFEYLDWVKSLEHYEEDYGHPC
jgi:hypothetical protein